MRVPYSVQGFLFAPSLIGLIFILQVTCPAPVGGGCFADAFTVPMFLPAIFVHSMWSGLAAYSQYELLFIVMYWSVVGLLLGLCFDIFEGEEKEL